MKYCLFIVVCIFIIKSIKIKISLEKQSKIWSKLFTGCLLILLSNLKTRKNTLKGAAF